MTATPRKLFQSKHAQELSDETVLCKYMPYKPHFESLIQTECLYLRRLNEFEDKLEGTTSLAEWDATKGSEVSNWYEENKFRTFVTCFVIGETEQSHMWENYAGGRGENGLMIMTTVERLRSELSYPACTVCDEMIRRGESASCDSFTIGGVTYFADDEIDHYNEMAEGLSETRHVFRKRQAFENEQEFRVALRPSSQTSEAAFRNGAVFCLVPIRLSNLVTEIRLKPDSSNGYRGEVIALLDGSDLRNIPVQNSNLASF
jgi:hypothetical protein